MVKLFRSPGFQRIPEGLHRLSARYILPAAQGPQASRTAMKTAQHAHGWQLEAAMSESWTALGVCTTQGASPASHWAIPQVIKGGKVSCGLTFLSNFRWRLFSIQNLCHLWGTNNKGGKRTNPTTLEPFFPLASFLPTSEGLKRVGTAVKLCSSVCSFYPI